MSDSIEASFAEVVSLIEQARKRAYEAVGQELVGLYWRMGEYINRKIETAEWGEGVVDGLARHLTHRFPGRRGFTSRNQFGMKQFYEAYRVEKKVSSLMTQIASARSGTPPRAGRDSCQRESSRRLEGEVDLFWSPGRERQGGLGVFVLDMRVGRENLVVVFPRR